MPLRKSPGHGTRSLALRSLWALHGWSAASRRRLRRLVDMDQPAPETKVPEQTAGKHNRILIGLLVGTLAGICANQFLGADHAAIRQTIFYVTEPIGELFMRLLFMTVIPLVFSSLIVGLYGLGG